MAAAARLLSDAFHTQDCKTIRQYIKKGYDCNARLSEHPCSSLLHMVAYLTCTDCDKCSMAQKLLAGGADVNAKNNGGYTPLIVCVLNGKKKLATVLIQAGADVHAAKRTSHGGSRE
jgi:ankyrin repeat protein